MMAGGPDEYGFSAFPAGCWISPEEKEDNPDEYYSCDSDVADFWISKELNADSAYVVEMEYFHSHISKLGISKGSETAVRCVKNK